MCLTIKLLKIKKKRILPFLSSHKQIKNMKNAVKSRIFSIKCLIKIKVIIVFIHYGFDKREHWVYQLAGKFPNSTTTHLSLLIEMNHDSPSDHPETVLIRNMSSYSFNYLKKFLKTDFFLCDTNVVAAKLYTSLCIFNNNLNAINYLFNLIIW